MTMFEGDPSFEWTADPDEVTNEQAAVAMISLLGGLGAMMARGVKLTDVGQILLAVPDDDLGGLRAIAASMRPKGEPIYMTLATDTRTEPLMSPELAHEWLLRTG